MIWVDNLLRGTGGAQVIGYATIFGQAFTEVRYGGVGGELIFSLDHNEHTGTVHILATLRWLQATGTWPRARGSGRWTSGGKYCSTGHRPEKFTVNA